MAIAVGEQHAEPVQAWLHKAHEMIDGSSVIAGILEGSALVPPKRDAYLFYDASDPKKSGLLNADEELGNIFCAVAPNLICGILPSAEGLQLFRKHQQLPRPLTGLVCCHEVLSLREPRKPSQGAYDPLNAQIREVLNSSSAVIAEQLKTLGTVWRHSVGGTPPQELRVIENTIMKNRETLREFLEVFADDRREQAIALGLVDNLSAQINAFSSNFDRLIRQANQYASPKNLLTEPVAETASYSEAVAPFFLRAARNLAEEFVSRSGIARTKVIPVIADAFTIHNDPFFVRYSTDWSDTFEKTVLATIPVQFRLRLGALPVLAHEIAHLVLDHSLLVEKLADRKYRAEKDSLTTTIEEISQMAEDDLPSKMQEAEMARAWALELLADCVAALIAGPAFLYAMARFATGTLSESRRKGTQTHPPFANRLRCCLAFLKARGFDVPFQSKLLTVGDETIGNTLSRDIQALVPRPYTVTEHDDAKTKVKEALQNGRVPDAAPTAVLNALWDAVVRKESYVNEIASLFAMYQ
ncbi:MAG: hypothetical protein LAO76_11000 [Acidobacteriia bacterium]|nr:hypothetical protein [Terriglobia bacterium]